MRLQVKVIFQHSQTTDSHRGGLGVFVPQGRYHGLAGSGEKFSTEHWLWLASQGAATY